MIRLDDASLVVFLSVFVLYEAAINSVYLVAERYNWRVVIYNVTEVLELWVIIASFLW